MQTSEVAVPSDNVRRRNIYLGLGLVFLSLSCMFIFGLKGMIWLMWRDEPIAAAMLAAIGVYFVVRWWRVPKE